MCRMRMKAKSINIASQSTAEDAIAAAEEVENPGFPANDNDPDIGEIGSSTGNGGGTVTNASAPPPSVARADYIPHQRRQYTPLAGHRSFQRTPFGSRFPHIHPLGNLSLNIQSTNRVIRVVDRQNPVPSAKKKVDLLTTASTPPRSTTLGTLRYRGPILQRLLANDKTDKVINSTDIAALFEAEGEPSGPSATATDRIIIQGNDDEFFADIGELAIESATKDEDDRAWQCGWPFCDLLPPLVVGVVRLLLNLRLGLRRRFVWIGVPRHPEDQWDLGVF
ncbi:hypothetical protein CONLIGDRAFT_641333 [Coniochaeta ligniaria NRRL 30616]|uniref:Uncharacterized protein n=1 Tax=Coniochaeta ligniaria NRRL 30616 TaxID=1408157 RepID=A0A1J7IWI6_9PEZI|nr:hypothetical protein CONLIGDRAFT_641333 [Coniochaeta ligniaria NRRL 30616]